MIVTMTPCAHAGRRTLRLGACVATLLLGGCAGGANFAPVDEMRSDSAGRVAGAPATQVVTPGTPAGAEPAAANVQVRTIPYDGAAAPALPLGEHSGTPASPTAPLPPAEQSLASIAPATVTESTPTPPVPATLSPAVVALVNDADQRAAAGQHDREAASVERALQVEPGNAWLWHRLARARLAQGRTTEAENLAGRSNSLAAGDSRLQAGNWRLIEQARRGRGDTGGANEAARNAVGFETG